MRRNRVLVAVAAVMMSLAGSVTSADAAAAAADPYGRVLNILPPGQSGSINAAELAAVLLGDPVGRVAIDGRNAPRNFADQLEMYDALGRLSPGQIAGADLSKYYKDAGFEPDTVVRQARPKSGVTIRWDSFGVPYIKGATRADVAWGAGYAGTLDRMFLQDVLRHAGAARAAEFLGGTDANIAMDQEQLRTAPYTEQEAAAQIVRAAERYGAEGSELLAVADAYLAGINAAQDRMCPLGLPTGLDCPAEYVALGKKPERWDRADLAYVASLVGGIFGKGGGGEHANALWFQRLRQRFGDAEARRVYDDLRVKNDPEAPTTATVEFPYGGSGGIDPDRPGVALPDLGGPTAPGSGATAEGDLPPLDDLLGDGELPALPGRLDTPFGTVDLRLSASGMSNAALVAADRTRDGHPVAVFGPQTGYFTPQLLTEQVLDGPGVKARGAAFAGVNMVVQLGRGADYAWSATSASSDNVDTVAERLCNMDGSPATVRSEAYLKDGVCTPLDIRTHTETVLPNPTAPGLPKQLRFQVMRTDHGVVQLRTTAAGGTPVAIVLQRSTYQHEVDSVVGFARVNDPGFVRDAASFQRAMHGVDYTFNWFYADDRDIAYFGSGLLPERSPEVEFDLPRWGDARYDWRGWLPFEGHARQVNPPTGYLASWNNKQAPGFSAADNVWGYGPVYRSLALSDRLTEAAGARDVTPESLAGLVEDAATVDSRARYTLPMLLDAVGDDPSVAASVALLRAWLADGAHRVDPDRDGSYGHQAAIAIFDAWWEEAAKATLRGGLGGLVDELPRPLDDHPRQGLGSSWNNVAWYGYVSKDLRQLLGAEVTGRWHRSYCGDGALATCRASLRDSLAAAVSGLLRAQGKTEAAALTYDKHIDDIRSVTAGVVGVRPIDWQNRPTFQQVVAFTRHRS
ncbi:MAG TPA: penicillin acylase family protein [Streptosporangiaceae bacterium]|nr:penicillin acylase family protein [Streptosporangiaceae bacterium]